MRYEQPALRTVFKSTCKKMLFLTSMVCGEWKRSERAPGASSHTQLPNRSAGQQVGFQLLVWQERFSDSLVMQPLNFLRCLCLYAVIWLSAIHCFTSYWGLYLHVPLISPDSFPVAISKPRRATVGYFLLRGKQTMLFYVTVTVVVQMAGAVSKEGRCATKPFGTQLERAA